jgi:hypothetical protein
VGSTVERLWVPGNVSNHCKPLKIERLWGFQISKKTPSFRQATGLAKMGNTLRHLTNGNRREGARKLPWGHLS